MKHEYFLAAFVAIGEAFAEVTGLQDLMKPPADNTISRIANNAAFSGRSGKVRNLCKPASNRRGR